MQIKDEMARIMTALNGYDPESDDPLHDEAVDNVATSGDLGELVESVLHFLPHLKRDLGNVSWHTKQLLDQLDRVDRMVGAEKERLAQEADRAL